MYIEVCQMMEVFGNDHIHYIETFHQFWDKMLIIRKFILKYNNWNKK